MKEITLRLHDDIASYIEEDSKQMGITSEELIKHMVGSYVQSDKRHVQTSMLGVGLMDKDVFRRALHSALDELDGALKDVSKKVLKRRAQDGALSCKNCTMKLTEEDVDKGECGACHTPLGDTLTGGL